MPELSFLFQEVHFLIVLTGRDARQPGVPYSDWLECQITATAPGLQASFSWSVMPDELKALADGLLGLHERFPSPGRAALSPVEPNLSLSFELLPTGRIQGRCQVTPVLTEFHTMSGPFIIDQSHLPGLSSSIHEFVREATHGA